MTRKENNNSREIHDTFTKLSIQVGLNGLSFCVFDTVTNSITLSRRVGFGKELSPYELQKELREQFQVENIPERAFSEVTVIHRNNLFSLVPKAFFDKDELSNYIKFNAKILANDLLEYDEISRHDLVNVYVPFVNINNYVYDLFGSFEFMHSGTVLIQALLNSHGSIQEPVCYVHAGEFQLDIVVLCQKKLLFYNSFPYATKEDFVYYLLFTLEQLKLDTETIKTRLFGGVEEGDEIYSLCSEFIQQLSLFVPGGNLVAQSDAEGERIDFTVLSAL